MKQVFRLIAALLLACVLPAWAAPVNQEPRKSYEDMTPHEIRAEVEKLERELVNQASRLSGLSFGGSQTENKPDKDASEAPMKAKQTIKPDVIKPTEPLQTETIPRRKPVRQLRQIRQKALVATNKMTEEQAKKISMHTLIKNEVAKLERERLHSEQKKPKVVRLNPLPKAEEPKVTMGDDGKREIELELPLHSNEGKHRKKEKVKVRVKPEIMAIHNQVQGLKQMLIDDVVRMTGKPLQKGRKQKVRRK